MSLQAEIKKRFSGFTLEVSLHTEEGVLGILGASGSGKSMTLKCIAGIETPDEGRIVLNRRVLFDSEKRINLPPQKRRVGYLFQNYALFPNMTVEANIAAGLTGTKQEKKEAVSRMIKRFKLDGLEKRYPSQLSGGQQQRVALARILIYEPDVIMLDEPFSALDFYLKEQMQFQVLEVMRAYRGDALLVTHSRDEVYRFCEKSIILNRGRVAMEGGTREIFRDPVQCDGGPPDGLQEYQPRRARGREPYPRAELGALSWRRRGRLRRRSALRGSGPISSFRQKKAPIRSPAAGQTRCASRSSGTSCLRRTARRKRRREKISCGGKSIIHS